MSHILALLIQLHVHVKPSATLDCYAVRVDIIVSHIYDAEFHYFVFAEITG